MTRWRTVERPGWFGEARKERIAGYDEKYGEGNWRLRHQLGPRLLNFDQAVRLYELSYELHMLNPGSWYLWRDLMGVARDVWTETEEDVRSGTNYATQLAPAHHYEDIAVRRILSQHGLRFKGDRLVRIRADADDAVGVALSSIHVPFCLPEAIEDTPPGTGIVWWNRHGPSVELFWHNNKVLQVREG